MTDMTSLQWAAAALVATLATGRITRFVTVDTFPPMAWLRGKWDDATGKSPWNDLLHCSFCASFWAGMLITTVGVATGFCPAWWFICGSLSAIYVAGMIVASDWG